MVLRRARSATELIYQTAEQEQRAAARAAEVEAAEQQRAQRVGFLPSFQWHRWVPADLTLMPGQGCCHTCAVPFAVVQVSTAAQLILPGAVRAAA